MCTGVVGTPSALSSQTSRDAMAHAFTTKKGEKLVITNMTTNNKGSFSTDKIFLHAGSTEKTEEKALQSPRSRLHLKTHQKYQRSDFSLECFMNREQEKKKIYFY